MVWFAVQPHQSTWCTRGQHFCFSDRKDIRCSLRWDRMGFGVSIKCSNMRGWCTVFCSALWLEERVWIIVAMYIVNTLICNVMQDIIYFCNLYWFRYKPVYRLNKTEFNRHLVLLDSTVIVHQDCIGPTEILELGKIISAIHEPIQQHTGKNKWKWIKFLFNSMIIL